MAAVAVAVFSICLFYGCAVPCLSGIRIQTTHAASIKRKYTVWGVSGRSADKLEFDVEEEVSGRKMKTTVAEYFKDRYKLPLRYMYM